MTASRSLPPLAPAAHAAGVPVSGLLLTALVDRAHASLSSDSTRDADLGRLADSLLEARKRLAAVTPRTSDTEHLAAIVDGALGAMARATVHRETNRVARLKANRARRFPRRMIVWGHEVPDPLPKRRTVVRIMRAMVVPVTGERRLVLETETVRVPSRYRLRTAPTDVHHRRGAHEWSGGHTLPRFDPNTVRLVGRRLERRAAADTVARGLVVPIVRRSVYVLPRKRSLGVRGERSALLLNVNRERRPSAPVAASSAPVAAPAATSRGRIITSRRIAP